MDISSILTFVHVLFSAFHHSLQPLAAFHATHLFRSSNNLPVRNVDWVPTADGCWIAVVVEGELLTSAITEDDLDVGWCLAVDTDSVAADTVAEHSGEGLLTAVDGDLVGWAAAGLAVLNEDGDTVHFDLSLLGFLKDRDAWNGYVCFCSVAVWIMGVN